MNLTKNSIGNLINRYKAVLKKCSLMNVFGSLAVAGMLVAGVGVGVAGAAGVVIDANGILNLETTDTDVVIGTGQTHQTISGVTPGWEDSSDAAAAINYDITLNSGGSLTLETSTGEQYQRIMGYTVSTNELNFVMNEGSTLTVNATVLDASETTAIASIDAYTMKINGGEVNLEGRIITEDTNIRWDENAYIGGYNDFDITGGTVNVKAAHLLTASTGKMTIGGGDETATVNLQGDSLDGAGFIRASDSATDVKVGSIHGKLEIQDNAQIIVAAGNFGAILSRETDMTGGELNVAGNLTIAGAAMKTGSLSEDLGGNEDTHRWGDFNVNGGIVDVTGAGLMDFATYNVDLNIGTDAGTTGTVNTTSVTMVATTADTTAAPALDADGKSGILANTINITDGGKLVVGTTGTTDGTMKLTAGTFTNAGDVDVNGNLIVEADGGSNTGTMDVTGYMSVTDNATYTNSSPNGVLTVTGMTTLGTTADSGTAGIITNAGTANLNGGLTIVEGTYTNSGTTTVGGTTTIGDGAAGGAVDATFNNTGGTATFENLTVNADGNYINDTSTTINGLADFKAQAVVTGTYHLKGETKVAETLTINAGTVNNAGTMNVTGATTLANASAVFNNTSTANFKNTFTLTNGAYNNNAGGTTTVTGATAINGGTYTNAGDATTTFTGGLTVADAATKLVITGGTVNVTGTLTTSGTSNADRINVSGGHLDLSGLTANAVGGNVSLVTGKAGVFVTSGSGTITVNKGNVLNADYNGVANGFTAGSFNISGGGILKIADFTFDDNFTTDGDNTLAGINTALFGANLGAGLLDVGAATIDSIKAGNEITYKSEYKNVTNDIFKQATVIVDDGANIAGGYGSVKTTGNETEISILAGATLNLAGSDSLTKGLATDKGNNIIGASVTDDSILLLGDAGKTNSGEIGDIELNNSGTLSAVGDSEGSTLGTFTTGAITGAGDVEVVGTNLNTGAIGVSDNINVIVNGGNLSTDSVKDGTFADVKLGTGNLTLTDSTAQTGTITTTGVLTLNGSSISARCDITGGSVVGSSTGSTAGSPGGEDVNLDTSTYSQLNAYADSTIDGNINIGTVSAIDNVITGDGLTMRAGRNINIGFDSSEGDITAANLIIMAGALTDGAGNSMQDGVTTGGRSGSVIIKSAAQNFGINTKIYAYNNIYISNDGQATGTGTDITAGATGGLTLYTEKGNILVGAVTGGAAGDLILQADGKDSGTGNITAGLVTGKAGGTEIYAKGTLAIAGFDGTAGVANISANQITSTGAEFNMVSGGSLIVNSSDATTANTFSHLLTLGNDTGSIAATAYLGGTVTLSEGADVAGGSTLNIGTLAVAAGAKTIDATDGSFVRVGAITAAGVEQIGFTADDKNSILSFGSMTQDKLTPYLGVNDGFTATSILAINKELSLANISGISIGNVTGIDNVSTDGKIGAGTLIVADISGLDSGDKLITATTPGGTINISEEAGLFIIAGDDLELGDGIQLTENVTVSIDGGELAYADIDSILYTLDVDGVTVDSKGNLIAEVGAASADAVNKEFGNTLDSGVLGILTSMTKKGGVTDINAGGYKFLKTATTNANASTGTAIQSAADVTAAAAAPQMAMAISSGASSITTNRTSFLAPTASTDGTAVAMNEGDIQLSALTAEQGMSNGVGLWFMPMYRNQSVYGYSSGGLDTGYDASFGGAVFGVDYTINNAFRFGASFNVGVGNSESTGDLNDTTNDFNYWGLGLYAGYQINNFGLTADVSYSSNYSEIDQYQMATLGGDLDGDINSYTLAAGLRAEYKIATSVIDIIPHVGVRVTSMNSDSYDMSNQFGAVIEADSLDATIWTFPIGVTFSKDIETGGGWTVQTQLDLNIVPAAGDVEVEQDIRFAGVAQKASMESNVMDYLSYGGGLGFTMSKDNISMGLNYNLQLSEHMTDHGVQATLRYEF